MPVTIHLVFTTCRTLDEADALAASLVGERLAACATVLPGAVSHYRWEGKSERTEECMLLLKTTHEALASLERRLLELHPYDCPEFVAVPGTRVNDAYAAWVEASVSPA